MAKAPPSFNLYPGDLVKSCVEMDATEFGAYMRLLCYQWEHGAVPNEVKKLARICGMDTSDFTPVWSSISSRFDDVEGENLKVQSRLANQRVKDIETWAKRRSGGKSGGRPKGSSTNTGVSRKPQGYGRGSENKTSTEKGEGKREKGIRKKNESTVTVDELLSIEIPSELNASEFLEAWPAWVAHKQDPLTKPRPWGTVAAAKAQLTRLSSHGPKASAAGIWLSISENWDGIWPDRVSGNGRNGKHKTFAQQKLENTMRVASEPLPPELRGASLEGASDDSR